jgi:dipeptidyl aminopeptidase/acylaminoacyl peptidase
MNPTALPYGTWPGALSARRLAESLRLNDVQWDDASGALVWHESAGKLGALYAQLDEDAPRLLTGADFSVRGGVGYGGGDFTVRGGRVICAGPGGRLYAFDLDGGSPRPITPGFGSAAAPALSHDQQWVLFIHTDDGRDCLALVAADGEQWPRQLLKDSDFVMQPAWHPAGEYAACITWDHPNMPWDGSVLRLLRLTDGNLVEVQAIAGGDAVAVMSPAFSPDGRWLAYISDESGWGQIMRYELATGQAHPLTSGTLEHGLPAWVQGLRTYAWLPDSSGLVYTRQATGVTTLWQHRLGDPHPRPINTAGYTAITQPSLSPAGDLVAFIGSSPTQPPRIVSLPVDDRPLALLNPPAEGPSIIVGQGSPVRVHRRAGVENLPPARLSQGQPIQWAGPDGEPVYGVYYPPAPTLPLTGDAAPPLIVIVHGGPTSQVGLEWQAAAQYFATQGYAVLYPNHRGSSGYGRAYLSKLDGQWGVADVEDSISGARHLTGQGLADAERWIIMGGSAGGYTVLQALVREPGCFRAGVCLYGISDLFALQMETHKFEAHYNDRLLGPLPAASAVYRERSPLFHAERITDPVLFLHGEDDPVVPINQAEGLYAALQRRGVPCEFHRYAGEGHGFRAAQTLEHVYTTITRFLLRQVVYR